MKQRMYTRAEIEYAYAMGENYGIRQSMRLKYPELKEQYPLEKSSIESMHKYLDSTQPRVVSKPLPWYEDVTSDQVYWTALVCIIIAIIIFF